MWRLWDGIKAVAVCMIGGTALLLVTHQGASPGMAQAAAAATSNGESDGAFGCTRILRRADPLVGTWRSVGDKTPERMVLNADGTFTSALVSTDGLPDEFVALMTAVASVPGTYRHSDKTLILTQDAGALKESLRHLAEARKAKGIAPQPETQTSPFIDFEFSYSVHGDILTTKSSEGVVTKYVREK